MDIKILKSCVIDGKSHKPGKKKVTVSKKDGAVLVSLGKAEDLSPKKEELSLNMEIDVAELAEVQKEMGTLKGQVESLTKEGEEKDKEIETLKGQVESLTKPEAEEK